MEVCVSFLYQAFGLTIASEFACPDLPASTGSPDVKISIGRVGLLGGLECKHGGCFAVRGDQYLLNVDGVARYLVESGRSIVIEPAGGDESSIRAFLFGPVLGVLLFQRKQLTYCGNAFETPRGAILLVGLSASGKSTAAAVLARRGYRLLSDGLISVAALQGQFVVMPGLPWLQLWADALSHLAISEYDVQAWRPGLRKYAVPMPEYCPDPLPLAAVYGFSAVNSDTSSIEQVHGFDKCAVLAESTHSRRFLGGLDPAGTCFQQVLRLAAAVPVKRLSRSNRPGRYEEVADLLEQDFSA